MTTSNNTTDLLVLSYNISYEAMTNNPRGSAGALGMKCVPVSSGSKLTVCANHMAQMIDKIPSSVGKNNFDIVGCQESSRWYELQAASNALSQLKSYNSKAGRSEMVTFYNDKKYQLDKHAHSSFDYDRPFQILVLSEISSSNGIIFINAHCPHHLPNSYDAYTFEAFSKNVSRILKSLGLTDQEKRYRLIATGDFNETEWDWSTGSLKEKSFAPFASNGIDKKLQINTTPFTCCQGTGVWVDGSGNPLKGHRAGDYIFDSKSPANAQVPSVYDYDKLLSDHLPVIALLP